MMFCYLNWTDLQLRLQLLREWLKRMDAKVPKLILRPKWKRQTLERRIMEFKVYFVTTRWQL